MTGDEKNEEKRSKDQKRNEPEKTAYPRLYSTGYPLFLLPFLVLCTVYQRNQIFYVLFINATRSNGALKKGFTAIPGGHLLENWKNLLAETLPVWNGMFNSVFIATCSRIPAAARQTAYG